MFGSEIYSKYKGQQNPNSNSHFATKHSILLKLLQYLVLLGSLQCGIVICGRRVATFVLNEHTANSFGILLPQVSEFFSLWPDGGI